MEGDTHSEDLCRNPNKMCTLMDAVFKKSDLGTTIGEKVSWSLYIEC